MEERGPYAVAMLPPRAAHHAPPAAWRLLLGALVAAALLAILPRSWEWEARGLAAWVGFCAANLLRVLPLLGSSPERTEAVATREDETHAVAAALTIGAALVSLGAALLTLRQSGQEHGAAALRLSALAFLTVALSWVLVQLEYTLHYARRFYQDGAGVVFLGPDPAQPLNDPAYLDFAYLAFTIGMTFQVSDTNLNTPQMRQLLLGHALLSYLFSVVIIGVTVSAVAGLVG